MSVMEMSPATIRRLGIEALTKALGPAGMARFLQQYELGSGDYTRERDQWLGDLSLEDILGDIRRHRGQDGER